LVDLGSSSAIIPKVTAGVITGDKTISHNGCATQMFFFVIFVTTENYLLASMAYDRHVAVCKPLHYSTIMSSRMCVGLTISSYVCGSLNSSIHIGCTFSLSFCSSNIVNHFFCDIPPILTLSCSDIHFTEFLVCIVGAFNIAFALLVIVTSYLSIFIAILRIRSNEGRQKAFFTCACGERSTVQHEGTGDKEPGTGLRGMNRGRLWQFPDLSTKERQRKLRRSVGKVGFCGAERERLWGSSPLSRMRPRGGGCLLNFWPTD
ncbi:olfactory receptor 5B12-like, partial [Vombatus ursinus]|uniref:olfactory receptor 5B12-like n=1 Tax=Vombatus ursinus TaxID=29139 RepID=UPI000FFD24E6